MRKFTAVVVDFFDASFDLLAACVEFCSSALRILAHGIRNSIWMV